MTNEKKEAVTSENENAELNNSTDPEGNAHLDLGRLRLGQDFEEKVGVRKALLTVPVRKPDRQSFVRVHPNPSWRLDTATLTLKEERETFLVDPSLWPELQGELAPTALFTAITRQGVVFIWPVRLPGPDGRLDTWSRSALDAVAMAQQGWVRVAANMSLGAYDVFVATGEFPDPEWPEVTFQQLLEIAFRDRYIRDPGHSVIRKLQGL
jgi:hypothetical protein